MIEQAIYGNVEAGGYRFLARSPGFSDDWLAEAERLCAGFGERPAGVACPGCVFAQPFGRQHVAVVQVADQGRDDAGRPGALGFRLLVVPRGVYNELLGDPFILAERLPPPWSSRGELPALAWAAEPLPTRTIEQIQGVLKNGDSPTLLGGAQVLVDAGRLVFERPGPDTPLLRNLWLLLPSSTRSGRWPASFAFGNALGFDAVVVPRADPAQFAGYVTEEQAGDYPEGRYELGLQIAVEAGDQRELDALFARRSSRQTLKLALALMVGMALIALFMNSGQRSAPTSQATQPGTAQAQGGPVLADAYPPWSAETRSRLAEALRDLADKAELTPIPDPATVEELLAVLRVRLTDREGRTAPTDVGRRLQQLDAAPHPERLLRGLLWAYGSDSYNDSRLNPVELVQHLQTKLVGK